MNKNNPIIEVSLFTSNDTIYLNIWRKDSDCPRRHEITTDARGLTVQKILNKYYSVGSTMIYPHDGNLIVHYYPKPTGKVVDAHPVEETGNNFYNCPMCHRQNAFSSWVYAHWDINTEHKCFCGTRNIIKQGKLVKSNPAQDEYRILDAKFFPEKDGKQIVAVAVAGVANDWAAYISTASASAVPSAVTQFVAAQGVKMYQSEAEGMFPGHKFWKRDYRR